MVDNDEDKGGVSPVQVLQKRSRGVESGGTIMTNVSRISKPFISLCGSDTISSDDKEDSTRSENVQMWSVNRAIIQMLVKPPIGNRFSLFVDRSTTIKDLKHDIAEKTGVLMDEQRLLLNGKQLDDGDRVEKYTECSLICIDVLLRCVGGHGEIVRIQTADGRLVVVPATGHNTLREVKDELGRRLHVEANDLQLMLNDLFYPDHMNLNQIGYQPGMIIHVIFFPGVPPVPHGVQERMDRIRPQNPESNASHLTNGSRLQVAWRPGWLECSCDWFRVQCRAVFPHPLVLVPDSSGIEGSNGCWPCFGFGLHIPSTRPYTKLKKVVKSIRIQA